MGADSIVPSVGILTPKLSPISLDGAIRLGCALLPIRLRVVMQETN